MLTAKQYNFLMEHVHLRVDLTTFTHVVILFIKGTIQEQQSYVWTHRTMTNNLITSNQSQVAVNNSSLSKETLS